MDFKKPKSRAEAILQNILGANNVLEPPKSRVEKLLLALLDHISNFYTKAEIDQKLVAAQSITDTGGYYSTDTVDGALQEIGAELAGVNTLIGSGVIT